MWGGAQEFIGLLSDGTVWTWGHDDYGILGNGSGFDIPGYTNTQYDSLVPVQVLGPRGVGVLTGMVAIAGGERHNVALDANGNVWTWGYNYDGELGIGTYPPLNGPGSMDNTVPIQITNGFTSVTAIASRGYHTLALKNDGTVWAWGYNAWGQLGDNSNTDRHSPVQVSGLSGHGGVINIVGGGDISAALMADHTLLMWGRNRKGEMGNGTTDAGDAGQWFPGPVSQASGLTNVQALALGWSHVVALASDGTVWTWGQNLRGELGLGAISSTGTNMPTQVAGLTNIIQVSAGDGFSAVLKSDGTVWTWGYNGSTYAGTWGAGELGNGTTNDSYSPVQVVGLTNAVFVRARDWKTLALKADGTAWAWGWDEYGELGDGANNTNRLSPVRVHWPIIRAFSSGCGAVSPSGAEVVGWGSTDSVMMTASNWYHLAAFVVDGTNVGSPDTYTFTNVVMDHTITASFAPDLATNNTPKWWLYQANTNWSTNFDAAALSDFDGDGMSTWQEYLAGTDPMNSNSFLGFIAVTNPPSVSAGFVIQWSSVTGKWYHLDRSTNLLAIPPFDYNVRSNIQATPPLNTETDTTATSQGPFFYRIGVP